MWPLSFWLPTTYTAAAPPVAAVFAIMSKVGIYVVLRLSLLLFAHGEEPAQFGSEWLLYGGMATIAFGMVGVLAAQETARIAGFTILVSSGTLLAAVGTNRVDVTVRSEEHTSELQSLMRISYAVFCLKKKTLLTQYIYPCKHTQTLQTS